MPSYGLRLVRFSAFEVDLRAGELRRNGVKVKIQNQPFQILAMLLERPGEIITRDEMQARLWPAETFVDFDHGLNSAIRRVRDALGDSAESPTFVETLGRRGYRFIFPVEKLPVERPSLVDGHEHSALAEVVPISGPEPGPAASQPPVVARPWKLKTGLAFAVATIVTSAVLLSNENSFLSRTRLGETARRLALKDRAPTPRAVTQRRLTASPHDTPVTSGVISPDGKYLAYTDSTGFYLRQVDSGETHPVPLPEGFDAAAESWFPDNLHLVVSWVEDSRKPPSLWKISIFGGTPRKLADKGSSASVSPDGSHIVFLAGMWDHEEIWQIEADGGSARRLLNGVKDDFGPVAWAPDGKRFAYVRMINLSGPGEPQKQVEVYELDSGRSAVILSEPRLGLEIAWTTGGRLIYSLQEVPPNQNDFNLWAVQLDLRTWHPSGPPVRITNDRAQTAGISVTSGGKRMALLRRAFQADVYLADLEAQGTRVGTPRRFTLDERQDFPSAWTADSKAVLIVSDRDGPLHIFKQEIDQTQPELLVGGKQDVWLPRLTPDGSNLLYMVSPAQGEASDNARLMRSPIAGGPAQLVLEGPGILNYQCAKLPSALCIYGQMDAESYRFFTFDPVGGKGTELLAARVKRENGPNNWNLSPDGKYLVIRPSQDPYKGPELRILSLSDNSTRTFPVPDLKLIIGMDWAADSKSVWVGGYNGRGSWGALSGLVNVDLTGKVRTLLAGHDPEIMGATPSPDGRHLALGENTITSDVWLLENF